MTEHITRLRYKRLIGSTWVDAYGPVLPDEGYDDFLARQAGIFGADRIRPAEDAPPPAPTALNLMVNSRTVAKVNLDADSGEDLDDGLKDTLLSLPPVEAAIGNRSIARWMVNPRWINILTEGSR